jgi:hypothetical protein
MENFKETLSDLWPELEKLIALDSEKQLEAQTALGKTERLLSSKSYGD